MGLVNTPPRTALLITMIVSSSATGIGAPVHGHAVHDGHDSPHVEEGHHSRGPDFVQGDDRVQERSPRLTFSPPGDERPSIWPERCGPQDAPAPERPHGRDPPLPSAPRAPPA